MLKINEVYTCLDNVYDPELDQSLASLGFVENVDVKEQIVKVDFRLPTYWCSPNFAYIMAEDIIKEIKTLSWVKNVKVELVDHSEADKVSLGATTGLSFDEMFPDMSDGSGLQEVRDIFKRKAFYARQDRLIRYLLKNGWTKESILSMDHDVLNALAEDDKQTRELAERYVDIRHYFQLGPENRVMTTHEGKVIDRQQMDSYLLHTRKDRMTMEFNSHYCQGLLQTRYDSKRLA
ncbi:iron-sulfur cluster assembly protein [Sinobaca sp. H24]|uniref:iron-sulfur cluster assembly protein n=1 Tax=Sinobaca sp. H24 TaxID=2923376 RepID=UPI00207A88DB|nr:iron-sulfur cluster assembly protein [Sinobaca sp. H24]